MLYCRCVFDRFLRPLSMAQPSAAVSTPAPAPAPIVQRWITAPLAQHLQNDAEDEWNEQFARVMQRAKAWALRLRAARSSSSVSSSSSSPSSSANDLGACVWCDAELWGSVAQRDPGAQCAGGFAAPFHSRAVLDSLSRGPSLTAALLSCPPEYSDCAPFLDLEPNADGDVTLEMCDAWEAANNRLTQRWQSEGMRKALRHAVQALLKRSHNIHQLILQMIIESGPAAADVAMDERLAMAHAFFPAFSTLLQPPSAHSIALRPQNPTRLLLHTLRFWPGQVLRTLPENQGFDPSRVRPLTGEMMQRARETWGAPPCDLHAQSRCIFEPLAPMHVLAADISLTYVPEGCKDPPFSSTFMLSFAIQSENCSRGVLDEGLKAHWVSCAISELVWRGADIEADVFSMEDLTQLGIVGLQPPEASSSAASSSASAAVPPSTPARWSFLSLVRLELIPFNLRFTNLGEGPVTINSATGEKLPETTTTQDMHVRQRNRWIEAHRELDRKCEEAAERRREELNHPLEVRAVESVAEGDSASDPPTADSIASAASVLPPFISLVHRRVLNQLHLSAPLPPPGVDFATLPWPSQLAGLLHGLRRRDIRVRWLELLFTPRPEKGFIGIQRDIVRYKLTQWL